jgi:hypothetical protein
MEGLPMKISQIQCPKCGTVIHYAEGNTKVVCNICNSTFDIPSDITDQNAEYWYRKGMEQAHKEIKEKADASNKKKIKALYIILAIVLVAIIGLTITLVVIKSKENKTASVSKEKTSEANTQAKPRKYKEYKIFDFSYSVPDDWEGDGKLDTNDTTQFSLDNGMYMIQRIYVGDRIENENNKEDYVQGVERSTKSSWIVNDNFYLDGQISFIMEGKNIIDNDNFHMFYLVTQYNGYLYTFMMGTKEGCEIDYVDELFDSVHLTAMNKYLTDNVEYYVPANWQIDSDYQDGLRFNGLDYGLVVEKIDAGRDITWQNDKAALVKAYSDSFDKAADSSRVFYQDDNPAITIQGSYLDGDLMMYVHVFVYQVDGYQYVFNVFTTKEDAYIDDINNIFASIHKAR